MVTITHAATATWSTTGGNTTVTATPAVGDLIVIIAPCTLAGGTISVTDNNSGGAGVYTKIGSSFTGFSTAGDLSIWVRQALIGSASSTIFTATQTSSTGGGLDVFRVSGMFRTGANAVRSSGGQSTGTSGTTPAPVLSLTPLTANPIIGAACCGTNATTNFTPPASFTEATDLGYNTPATGMETVFINSGIANATITWGSTAPSAFASMVIELDITGSAGPPLGWGNPAGVRVNQARTGTCMATQVTIAQAVVPPSGPPFEQAITPAQARIPRNAPRGRVYSNKGAPVNNPVKGPPFEQAIMPARACIPRNGPRGRVYATAKPVLRPVTAGPPFTPFNQEVRSAFPQQPFLRGRVYSNRGAPVANPSKGPFFEQAQAPAQARILRNAPRGRVYRTVTPPVIVVLPPAPVYPQQQALRAKLPLPRRGTCRAVKFYPLPANPAAGPPFEQAITPAQARILRNAPRGRVYSTPLPTVKAPTTGPLVQPLQGEIRSQLPPLHRTGRVYGNPGSPVRNATAGPFFKQAVTPAQARIPRNGPRGRVYFTPLPVVKAPTAGPKFYPFTQEVRAAFPQQPVLRGRIASNAGSAPRNPTAGPAFRQAAAPSQARIARVFSKGRVYGNPGKAVTLTQGPPFEQAITPAQARIPQVFSKGRVYRNPGAQVKNPTAGPRFTPFRWMVQATDPPPRRGRVYLNAGAPVQNPNKGPAFRQAVTALRAKSLAPPKGSVKSAAGALVIVTPNVIQVLGAIPGAIRAALPQGVRAGSVRSNPGGPVLNPQITSGPPLGWGNPAGVRVVAVRTGIAMATPPSVPSAPVPPNIVPVTGAMAGPSRAALPVNPRGRVASSAVSAAVQVTAGPPFSPFRSAVRIHPSLPSRGRVYFTPRPAVSPITAGPPLYPVNQEVRSAFPQQPVLRGRVYGNKGASVQNPVSGPVFRQATSPVQAKHPLPSRGRAASNIGTFTLEVTGPAFFPIRFPARARIVQNAPRGRVYSNPGAPVKNPTLGPAFRQAVHPISPRIPQVFSKGRIYSNPGGPSVSIGPRVTPLHGPVIARKPLPPKGRVYFNKGGPSVSIGPVFRQAVRPVQARVPLPSRGRVYSNPGIKVAPPITLAPIFPLEGPVRARRPLPPKGRVSSGKGALVQNPVKGPVFHPAVKPARAVIPVNAPRGRTASNPGGPVENIPFITAVYKYGVIHFGWSYSSMNFEWTYGDPQLMDNPQSGWEYGDLHFQWAYGDPHSAWEYGELEEG